MRKLRRSARRWCDPPLNCRLCHPLDELISSLPGELFSSDPDLIGDRQQARQQQCQQWLRTNVNGRTITIEAKFTNMAEVDGLPQVNMSVDRPQTFGNLMLIFEPDQREALKLLKPGDRIRVTGWIQMLTVRDIGRKLVVGIVRECVLGTGQQVRNSERHHRSLQVSGKA